jgi:hypothetical protein
MKTYFTGIIKPEIKDGMIGWPKWSIMPYRFAKLLQKALWKIGIAIYDPVFGECTPDFNCCTDIGRKKFLSWHPTKEAK